MNWMDIRITQKSLGNTTLTVDGTEMANLVERAFVEIRPGRATARLDVCLQCCDIDVDGVVKFNGCPVSDAIGRAIFESLKERYEGLIQDTASEPSDAE